MQNETELFKWRFIHNPPEDMNRWLADNGLRYEAISRDEKESLKDKLMEMARCRREEFSEHQEYYKVRAHAPHTRLPLADGAVAPTWTWSSRALVCPPARGPRFVALDARARPPC